MICRPAWINAFEFAVLAARRAEQLRRGCLPRVDGDHTFIVTAQLEIIAGRVVKAVEGIGQPGPEVIEPTEVPPASWDQKPQVVDVVRSATPAAAEFAESRMASGDRVTVEEKVS